MISIPSKLHRTGFRTATLGLALLAVTACSMNSGANPGADLEFRQERFDEVMRIESFQSCKNEALGLDQQARSRDSAGAYLTSAKVMQKCEMELSGSSRGIPENDRMHLSALATINFLKGGDTEEARRSLDTFKALFPGQDLYFSDGASFIETADLLMGRYQNVGFGAFTLMNVNTDVKNEMRRLTHWANK